MLRGGVFDFSIDFGISDNLGEVSMATLGVLQERGEMETRLYRMSEMKLDMDSSFPRENRICRRPFFFDIGVLDSSAKSALLRLKLSSGERPENICDPYGVANVSLSVDNGVMPWMFNAFGLEIPISRFDFGGESNIVFREDEYDIGSPCSFVDWPGVIFIAMNCDEPSCLTADLGFLGEYDIGVFWEAAGLSAGAAFPDEALGAVAAGANIGFGAYRCIAIMLS